MFTITGTRIVGLIAVICAVIVAPQALARPSTHSVNPAADVFERFAAAHTHPALSDRRSPDTRDVADVRQITLADRRSPDTIDIATGVSKELPIQVMTLTRLGQRGSFDWADAGIGATAAALILGLIGGSMLLLHMRPHRRQPAQTT